MPQSSVVRIYATTQTPDYDSPWQALSPRSSTGSGVVIARNQVLTGAHVIADATFVQVQRIDHPDKLVARVVSVCHDCDLALLEIDDKRFQTGVRPAKLGQLPDLRDRVAVIGFPVGGEEVSITEGVVSRIEVQRYSHSQRHLLAVTVDAAINDGNSGGPVFKDGKVVGIAFQKIDEADNIGEMVPAPIIEHFLQHAAKANVLRIPAFGVSTQNLENPYLRRKLGLADDEGGILVVSIDFGGSAWGQIQVGDALLVIDGHRIAANSTIAFRGRHRTRYDVMLGWMAEGDTIEVELLRDGVRHKVSLTLAPPAPLVPRSLYDCSPTYYIFGGLVFQILTRDYLATWDSWWEKAPKEFLHLYYSGDRTPERREVVILTQILADDVNVGYEGCYSEAVAMVNGRTPRDMIDFVRSLDTAQGLVEIRTTTGSVIVLDAADARVGDRRILERYRIASDRSADLLGLDGPSADRVASAASQPGPTAVR